MNRQDLLEAVVKLGLAKERDADLNFTDTARRFGVDPIKAYNYCRRPPKWMRDAMTAAQMDRLALFTPETLTVTPVSDDAAVAETLEDEAS